MQPQSALGRTISVAEYRALLDERHSSEHIVEQDAIEQTRFVFSLTRLYSRLAQDFEATQRRHGWTWAGFRIMNVLWAVGTVELRDLARLSGASRASISSALNTLERDGLVVRARDATDRRLLHLTLTDLGTRRLTAAMHEQAEQQRTWFEVLGSRDLARLNELVSLLADQPTPATPEQ